MNRDLRPRLKVTSAQARTFLARVTLPRILGPVASGLFHSDHAGVVATLRLGGRGRAE